MKQRGFTLIELMVSIAILSTVIIMAVGIFNGGSDNISLGINGLMESRCVEGYRFVVDQDGRARQILDELGKGVRCENPNAGKPGSFGKF